MSCTEWCQFASTFTSIAMHRFRWWPMPSSSFTNNNNKNYVFFFHIRISVCVLTQCVLIRRDSCSCSWCSIVCVPSSDWSLCVRMFGAVRRPYILPCRFLSTFYSFLHIPHIHIHTYGSISIAIVLFSFPFACSLSAPPIAQTMECQNILFVCIFILQIQHRTHRT